MPGMQVLSSHTMLGKQARIPFQNPCHARQDAVLLLCRCDGPLLAAIKAGDWVLLDELNLAGQSVLEGLNAVLDHRAEVGRHCRHVLAL